MEKQINDYLHLYMGCDFRYRYVDYEKGVWAIGASLTPKRLDKVLNDASIDGIQLLLRPLGDMTRPESISLELENVQIGLIAFEDLNMYMTAEQFKGCLDLHFDIFGLIDAGLAIDTTTPRTP